MNRVTTMTVFAVIFGVSMGILMISGVSVSPLATAAIPQAQSNSYMSGHIELTLYDENGSIKGYWQTDNQITDVGDDCTTQELFENDGSDICSGGVAGTGFDFIAIGNGTFTVGDGCVGLSATCTAVAASSGTPGEMAKRQDSDPVLTTSGGSGAKAVIATETAFTFGADNATTVHSSGLFDTISSKDSEGQTTTVAGKLFALQRLNGGSGIIVSNGDSLTVTWTITVGGND